PFQFAVVGGDGRTDWREVAVVPAPEFSGLKLRVAYPAYTGLPADDFPEGRGHVRAVVGSKVKVSADVNKPLVKAELAWEKGPATAAVVTLRDPGDTSSPDKSAGRLDAEFIVTTDDSYKILMTDAEGMSNALRAPLLFRVQATDDSPPDVAVENPAGDQEITAAATLRLKALVKDDFGVDDAHLVLKVERNGTTPGAADLMNDFRFPLFATPAERLADRSRLIEFPLSVQPLKLTNGSVVKLWIEARDRRDAPGPNVGKSREIRLTVVDKGEFLKQIENEQALLREQLERVLKLQQGAQAQVGDLEKEAEVVGKLGRESMEKLQSAETIQRRIREKMLQSDQSLTGQVDRMLGKLADNKVDDLETTRRLSMVRSELNRLSEQHLPPIEQAMSQARKTAALEAGAQKPGDAKPGESKKGDAKPAATKEGASADGKPGDSKPGDAKAGDAKPAVSKGEAGKTAEAKPGDTPSKDGKPAADKPGDSEPTDSSLRRDLAEAKDHQQQVSAALTQMLEQLDKWESVAQAANDARELGKRQAEIGQQVDKQTTATLGKAENELTPEQKAELAKIAARQEDNREQLQNLQRKMGRMAEKAATADPLSAEMLREAIDKTKQSNLAGKMSDAAKSVQQNRMGDAGQQQKDVAKAVADLIDTLENRREQELARLVKQLKEAEKEVANLREDQRKLKKQTKDAEAIADPKKRDDELRRLQKQQKDLQQKTEELARRLSRLNAEKASRMASRASSRMGDAGQKMQQGQNGGQGDQQKADDELEEAERQVAQARREAENQLAEEQLAKIADALRQVHERELSIKDELLRLDGLKSKKALSRGEKQSVAALARAQAGLATEADALNEKLPNAKAFVMVIKRGVGSMKSAADGLKKQEIGKPTQTDVDRAVQRFQQLLDSLRSEQKDGEDQKKQQGGGEGGGGGGGDGIPNIAQIRLIKSLQVELLDETERLIAEKAKAEQWTDEQQKRLDDVGKRQGELADLVRDMTDPEPEDKEGEEQ
ncbi:MAG: DUF4175 family protein, partial [Planctomycetia bacterium]